MMLLAASAVALVFLVVLKWQTGSNFWNLSDIGALPLKSDREWYRDLGGRNVPELQDLDLFYHDIGPSIAEARQADIILLGPSFVLYAFDPELLREFGRRHGIKIFNMAFFGVRSGALSREIIKKWSLKPRLWIINVDDQFDPFFSDSRKMWWFKSYSVPIPPLDYGRIKGWATVAKRNIRWRIEDYFAASAAGEFVSDSSVYRRSDDGSVHFGNNSKFRAEDNKWFTVARQDCHTNSTIVAAGKDFLESIGSEAILTLVPTSTACPQQATELAKQLDKQVLLPRADSYSSVDGGGHLDHNGAVAFTTSLLADLEKSSVFAAMMRR